MQLRASTVATFPVQFCHLQNSALSLLWQGGHGYERPSSDGPGSHAAGPAEPGQYCRELFGRKDLSLFCRRGFVVWRGVACGVWRLACVNLETWFCTNRGTCPLSFEPAQVTTTAWKCASQLPFLHLISWNLSRNVRMPLSCYQIAPYHSASLYVGDLSKDVAEATLFEIFSQVSRSRQSKDVRSTTVAYEAFAALLPRLVQSPARHCEGLFGIRRICVSGIKESFTVRIWWRFYESVRFPRRHLDVQGPLAVARFVHHARHAFIFSAVCYWGRCGG